MTLPFELSPRTLVAETPLQGSRVFVVPPRDQPGSGWAGALMKHLGAMGAEPQIARIDEINSLRDLDGPVIVGGNLANSDAVRELYFAFLSATDCRYPGPGGYEIRTLLDPFGRGHNLIHLGYSDEEGFRLGAERLLTQLIPITPRLSDIKATALPMPDFQVRQIRDATFPPLDWMITADNNLTHKAYLGYLTGDETLLAEAEEVWHRICEYGVPPKDHNVKDLHLRMSMLVSLFRLVETAGMLTDSLRGEILKFLLTWVYSDQGLKHLDIPENTAPRVQRQNHGTIPGLALAYLGAYVREYYPTRNEPNDWDVIIEKIFAPYAEGSWKSASEGICHGWWLEQPILLEYGLMDPERRFFRHDGARRAADCAMVVVNNFGWLSSSGDVNLLRAFPGPSLRVAAAWYRDPRYTFVHQLAPEYRSLRVHQFLLRAFDVGGEGVEPETGLTVVPLDPLVHEAASSNRHDVAPWMFETAPTAPVEKCFDKVVFRTGWTPQDAFLLIDGIGGGSHAYADALDLVEYSRLGYTFLVSETGVQYPETDSHAVVTVARDGMGQPIPCFAEQEAASWDADTRTGYARLVLRENNGSTWTRELFFLGDQGLVIHDHVRAEYAGDFTIQCNLRIPGKVERGGDRVISRREKNGKGDGEVVFALQSILPSSAGTQLHEEDVASSNRNPIGRTAIPREDDMVEAWFERYGTRDRVITISRSRVHVALEAGEGVSFVHYAHARRASDPDLVLAVDEAQNLWIRGGGELDPLKSHLKLEFAPPSVVADQVPKVEDERVACVMGGLDGPVQKIVVLGDDRMALVGRDGATVICDRAGDRLMGFAVEGPVHDADADGETLYIGHGAASLTAINLSDGMRRWEQVIERIPSSCAWWEWYTPAMFRVVAAKTGSGFDGVVVGCGDLHVRSFSPAGEFRWAFRYVNGVPGTIGLIDLNGDGIDEIVIGGEVMSNCAHCRVVNAQGELVQDLEVEGWTSRMTAQAFARGKKQWAAFGVTRGRNLNFYAIEPDNPEPLQLRWIRRGSGTTTDIVIDADNERLLVGNSLGLLGGYDFGGDQRGRVAFSSGIQKILPMLSGYLVGLDDQSAIWVEVDEQGRLGVRGQSATRGDWKRALKTKDGVLLPVGDKVIRLKEI